MSESDMRGTSRKIPDITSLIRATTPLKSVQLQSVTRPQLRVALSDSAIPPASFDAHPGRPVGDISDQMAHRVLHFRGRPTPRLEAAQDRARNETKTLRSICRE
ncbi:hypothetical protein ACO2JO_00750 [Leptospira interrogans]